MLFIMQQNQLIMGDPYVCQFDRFPFNTGYLPTDTVEYF
jgi:hypothetical protein